MNAWLTEIAQITQSAVLKVIVSIRTAARILVSANRATPTKIAAKLGCAVERIISVRRNATEENHIND
jgi:hypothetical protein